MGGTPLCSESNPIWNLSCSSFDSLPGFKRQENPSQRNKALLFLSSSFSPSLLFQFPLCSVFPYFSKCFLSILCLLLFSFPNPHKNRHRRSPVPKAPSCFHSQPKEANKAQRSLHHPSCFHLFWTKACHQLLRKRPSLCHLTNWLYLLPLPFLNQLQYSLFFHNAQLSLPFPLQSAKQPSFYFLF